VITKDYRQKLVPCISIPEFDRHAGYTAETWAFGERIDKSGNKVCGFFVDMETYDASIVQGLDGPIVATIIFKLPVHYVRWTDDSGRNAEGHRIRKAQPHLPKAVVYEIENSETIEWFNEQSSYIYDHGNLRHYMLFSEDIIDVICVEQPILFEQWKE